MAEIQILVYHFQRFDLLIHMHETAADNIRLKTSLKISLRCVVNPAGCLHYCACGFKHVSPTIVPSPNFHEGWNMLKTSSIANECSPICAASLESWGVRIIPFIQVPRFSRDFERCFERCQIQRSNIPTNQPLGLGRHQESSAVYILKKTCLEADLWNSSDWRSCTLAFGCCG